MFDRSGEMGHKIILALMLCLFSMVLLYLIRLVPLWAELPLMLLAGIPLSGVSAEMELYLSIGGYCLVNIFGLGFVAGYAHLVPFTLLFGLYPFIKPFFDSRNDMFLRWVLKMIYFSVVMYFIADGGAGGALLPYLEAIPTALMIPAVYVLFIAYDYLLLLFQYFYLEVIRPRM